MEQKVYNGVMFSEGMKVHYTSPHDNKENGIIKELRDSGAFVVYKCNGEWDRYFDYTGAHTIYDDITPGWV